MVLIGLHSDGPGRGEAGCAGLGMAVCAFHASFQENSPLGGRASSFHVPTCKGNRQASLAKQVSAPGRSLAYLCGKTKFPEDSRTSAQMKRKSHVWDEIEQMKQSEASVPGSRGLVDELVWAGRPGLVHAVGPWGQS